MIQMSWMSKIRDDELILTQNEVHLCCVNFERYFFTYSLSISGITDKHGCSVSLDQSRFDSLRRQVIETLESENRALAFHVRSLRILLQSHRRIMSHLRTGLHVIAKVCIFLSFRFLRHLRKVSLYYHVSGKPWYKIDEFSFIVIEFGRSPNHSENIATTH